MFGIETIITRLTEIRDNEAQRWEQVQKWRMEDLERINNEFTLVQGQWERQEKRDKESRARAEKNHEDVLAYVRNHVGELEAKFQACSEDLQVERAKEQARRSHKKLPAKTEESTANG